MSPLQQAAYSALMSTKDSSVNRALSDLGAADLRAKNYTRARTIFKEIVKRDPAGLGKSAAAILKVLDAGDAYHSAKFWFQARYIGKNALRTGGLLVAGIGATYAFVPHALIFYTAIYGGMGLAGARNILGRLWWKFPEAKMRAYLAGYHRNYVKALSDAIALAPPNVARELQFLRDRLETNDRERSDAEFQDERVEEALCPLDLRALAPAEELVEDGGPP